MRVGPLFGNWVRKRCEHLGISSRELATRERAGLSLRTISDIEHGNRQSLREDTLERLAKGLELDYSDELLPIIRETSWNFTSLDHVAQEVDGFVIQFIRQVDRGIEFDLLNEGYRRVLASGLERWGMSIESFLKAVSHRGTKSGEVRIEMPKPALQIKMEDQLKSLTFSYEESDHPVVLEVQHPKLLWDCPCHALAEKELTSKCPIHAHYAGEEVERRFKDEHVLIRWCGLKFYWQNRRELWPPSIDSFWFMQNLKREGMFDANIKNVLDLGSGTGFLGIVLAAHNPRVQRLDFADWLLTPLLYSQAN